MTKITYEEDGHGLGFIVRPVREPGSPEEWAYRQRLLGGLNDIEDVPSVYISIDYDFPALASAFGWSPKPEPLKTGSCHHWETDGTITCPTCGKTASEFITEAGAYLRQHQGIETEDPGYFPGYPN